MSVAGDLEEALGQLARLDIEVLLNENRSTMIRLLERKPGYARLSIHHMFLKAPQGVLAAIADFINDSKNRNSSKVLKNYIHQHLPSFSDERKIDPSSLVTLGEVHDLQMLYEEVNEEYFDNQLDLKITWYGLPQKKRGHQITYGLYHEPSKLIKIHRLLDRKICPKFYLSFVIYHEMLHEIHRPRKRGQNRHIHTPEFRAQERLFKEYEQASAWEKKSRHLFFR